MFNTNRYFLTGSVNRPYLSLNITCAKSKELKQTVFRELSDVFFQELENVLMFTGIILIQLEQGEDPFRRWLELFMQPFQCI